jgi:hypothetical protein
LNVIAVENNSVFVGIADVVLQFVRNAWMKIYGGCLAMLLHGSVRIVAAKMVSEINNEQNQNPPDNVGGF